ncbi:MAG: hypothetical protein PHX60_13330 [Giesbergeria sp.]|uniref:hypothetical protein n=1 Tax=Giesbergeria sp. TaxID=2818473 RepID=UPI0026312787|nr:hypothetical protein [Giesbergeria sp.]MDD2610642.1 hypothetical protein [Giesbergeria sp.]
MSNIYREFLALLPKRARYVGTVIASTPTGATVQLPSGGVLHVLGEATVGQRVFVRDGAIEGPAPTLVYVEAEV